MRAVVQRVSEASVRVENAVVGEISAGLVVLLGVAEGGSEDDEGKMNRSLVDVGGELLVVSQFTLLGDCRKGRRPSFVAAGPPEEANRLYQLFADSVRRHGVQVACGKFRAHMMVSLTNDGPVTLMIDSRKLF